MSTTLALWVDHRLRGTRPSLVVVVSASAAMSASTVVGLLWRGNLPTRIAASFWSAVHRLVQRWVVRKVRTEVADIRFPACDTCAAVTALPQRGWSADTIVATQRTYHEAMDSDMSKKLLSGVVYWGSHNHHELLVDVVSTQLWSNALFPDYFGASRRFEVEVTKVMLGIFNAPAGACATFTGGGTESILLAMLANRNDARARGIADPEVVLCRTAHQAFDKAAEYFGLKLVKVDVDPLTMKADVAQMRRCITPRTVCLVGSAPSYAYGIVDDLEAISALASEHRLGMHVDACLGGFLTQFLEAAGYPPVLADFRLPAVTSVSCDIHKWGGAPKGASIVMFRTPELRAQHVFACTDNPCGLYVTSGLSGSRPGYTAALAWATLLRSGKEHYAAACRDVVRCCHQFAHAVRETRELRLLGSPALSIVAMASPSVNVYSVMDGMRDEGFRMSPLQYPPAIHLGLTLEHAQQGIIEKVILALRKTVAACAKEGAPMASSARMYGSAQSIPGSFTEDLLRAYVDHLSEVQPTP